MAERLEDLNLPVTAIIRIIKEVLPPHVIISKDAKTALARAASVFILYVSNQATTIANSRNKKTISAQDVLEALSQVDFDCLIEQSQQVLEGMAMFYLFIYIIGVQYKYPCVIHTPPIRILVEYLFFMTSPQLSINNFKPLNNCMYAKHFI